MQNQYAPPQSQVADVYHNAGVVDDRVMDSLRRTRVWTHIASILFFTTAGITVVTITAVLLGNKLLGGGSGAEVVGALASNFLSLGFECFFGVLLFRYSANIARLIQTGSMQDLSLTMRAQRLFWKFFGIFILLMIGLVVLLVIGGIVFAIAVGAGAGM
jgi:type IV secretory pathway component VirB8